jgi:hypothetical protein
VRVLEALQHALDKSSRAAIADRAAAV